MANVGERERTQAAHVEYEDAKVALKTTWMNGLTVFFSPLLSQTYLSRTGGICAPESARGRHLLYGDVPWLVISLMHSKALMRQCSGFAKGRTSASSTAKVRFTHR